MISFLILRLRGQHDQLGGNQKQLVEAHKYPQLDFKKRPTVTIETIIGLFHTSPPFFRGKGWHLCHRGLAPFVDAILGQVSSLIKLGLK